MTRGERVLVDSDTKADRSTLMQYVTDVQHDERLLLWHITIDLYYYTPGHKKVGEKSFNYREFKAERFFDRRKKTLSRRSK